jgi:hypothetical protein
VAAKRQAVLFASGIEVSCPHCDCMQPNPDDGSHIWTAEQIVLASGVRTCTDCDEVFALNLQPRVHVNTTLGAKP